MYWPKTKSCEEIPSAVLVDPGMIFFLPQFSVGLGSGSCFWSFMIFFRLHIWRDTSFFTEIFFLQKKFIFLNRAFCRVFHYLFTLNSFRIRSCQYSECFFPGTDPAKRFGSGSTTLTFSNLLMWPVLRIWDVYPGSWFLPIPDPGSKNSNKRKGWKKIYCQTLFCSHKFHKIKSYFFLNAEEKNLTQFSKNYRTLYPKICH